MTDDDPTTIREEPVGAPVVRGDPQITGEYADQAGRFDPDDPDSLARATEVVQAFAAAPPSSDHLSMLEGAAACACLVRGTGSYKAAADRAGDPVTVSFLRKWARVHDLPIAIRRHIALGEIAPTAAQHIARLQGNARYLLAWAAIDNDLTVDEIRRIASDITNGTPAEDVLRDHGITPGEIRVTLPTDAYREIRRVSCLQYQNTGEFIAELYHTWADNDQ